MIPSMDASELLGDGWHDQPVVRVAKTMARWPNCTPGELLGELANVLDKQSELQDLGIDFAKLVAVATDTRLAEDEARLEAHEGYELATKEARSAVRWAVNHGLPPDVSARIFGLEESEVKRYLAQKKITEVANTVIALNRKGLSQVEIAGEVGVSKQRVHQILRENGEAPNKVKVATAPLVAERIKADKAAGYSLSEIAKRNSVSIDRVKNALYPRSRKAATDTKNRKAQA